MNRNPCPSHRSSKYKVLFIGFFTSIGLLVFQNCGKAVHFSSDRNKINEVPDHPDDPHLVKAAQQYSPVGNRYYVESVLRDVFMPLPENAVEEEQDFIDTVIHKNLGRRGDIFKGACNPTETKDDCLGASKLREIEHMGDSNIIRSTLTIYTCEKLLLKDYVIQYVLEKIKVEEGQIDSEVPFTNEAHVQQVVEMFYLGHDMDRSVTEALVELSRQVQEDNDLIEGWRAILLTLCSSPGWQTY